MLFNQWWRTGWRTSKTPQTEIHSDKGLHVPWIRLYRLFTSATLPLLVWHSFISSNRTKLEAWCQLREICQCPLHPRVETCVSHSLKRVGLNCAIWLLQNRFTPLFKWIKDASKAVTPDWCPWKTIWGVFWRVFSSEEDIFDLTVAAGSLDLQEGGRVAVSLWKGAVNLLCLLHNMASRNLID